MTAFELRDRLEKTYRDYAEQARKNREWERAAAFDTAADLVLGTTTKLSEARTHDK